MQILYAVDGSTGAAAAGRFLAALDLASTDTLTIMTVTADDPHDSDDETLHAAIEALGPSAARIRKVARQGHPAAEIVRLAEESPTDLIVVGSHGRSAIARFLVGSVAEQVARHAPCPVLLVRGTGDGPRLRRVVLGVDGSDGAARAAEWLRRFPLPLDSELRLVAILANLHDIARMHLVVTPPLAERSTPFDEWLREQSQKHLSAAAAVFAEMGTRVVTEVRSGDPAQGLIDVAEDEGADLVVVGYHGLGAVERRLLGSVSQEVLSHAACSVLVVRGAARA